MNECLINQSFVTFQEAESTLYIEVPTEGWMLPLREPKEGTAYGEKVRAEQKCLGSCPIHVGAVAEP